MRKHSHAMEPSWLWHWKIPRQVVNKSVTVSIPTWQMTFVIYVGCVWKVQYNTADNKINVTMNKAALRNMNTVLLDLIWCIIIICGWVGSRVRVGWWNWRDVFTHIVWTCFAVIVVIIEPYTHYIEAKYYAQCLCFVLVCWLWFWTSNFYTHSQWLVYWRRSNRNIIW